MADPLDIPANLKAYDKLTLEILDKRVVELHQTALALGRSSTATLVVMESPQGDGDPVRFVFHPLDTVQVFIDKRGSFCRPILAAHLVDCDDFAIYCPEQAPGNCFTITKCQSVAAGTKGAPELAPRRPTCICLGGPPRPGRPHAWACPLRNPLDTKL